jgi:titin
LTPTITSTPTLTPTQTPTATPIPPSAPFDTAAVALSATQVQIVWRDGSSNEARFELWRDYVSGAGEWICIDGNVPANATSYLDATMASGQSYRYKVRACNDGGCSAFSNEVYVGIPSALPAAPSGLTATALSSAQIRLDWEDSANNEAAFELWRDYVSGSGEWTRIQSGLPANASAFVDTTMRPGGVYDYRVRARNSAGASAYSNVVRVSVPASAPTPAPSPMPAAPSILTAIALSPSQVQLTWLDNASNETGFELWRDLLSGSGEWTRIQSGLPANAGAFVDTTMAPGQAYAYRVRARNSAGASAYSNTVSLSVPSSVPSAPTGCTAAAISSARVRLSWGDASNNEETFEVWRDYVSGSGEWTCICGEIRANAGSYLDTTMLPGGVYSYTVRARNSAGVSANSNTVTITAPAQ